MKKLKSVVLRMNYRKFFKWFLFVSLAVVLLGGILTGISFRTQISEGISYARTFEHDADHFAAGAEGPVQDGEGIGGYDEYRGHPEHDWAERIPFTEPSTGAKVTAGIFGCLCCLIAAVYWLAVVAWLYKAAAESGMSRLLWPLAGLIGNLLAVILFLAVRGITRKKCSGCGHWEKKEEQYCANCGARLREKCPACGGDCGSDDLYCRACGQKLRETDLQPGKG